MVLSAAAFLVLARLCARLDRHAGRRVFVGVALIAAGGITKPIYKLLVATRGEGAAPGVLDELLFWFLAPGFVFLAIGLAGGSRADRALARRGDSAWVLVASGVVLLGIALVVAGSGAWFPLLLAAATVGNVLVIIILVGWARRRDDRVAAGLFAASLAIVFALAWAAASLEQTIAVQWGEQLASTTNQALVMWASLRLRNAVMEVRGFAS